jgi:UV DNA damage repair endonuclease
MYALKITQANLSFTLKLNKYLLNMQIQLYLMASAILLFAIFITANYYG